jgi:hypothetical protein
MGLTNTLRLQHAVVVNLPGVDKKYGKDVRGCLIADNGAELCGSDLKNIESRLRDHYIYPHDPDYVNEMQLKDFDSHVDIAKLAEFITEDEEKFYNWYKNS